MKQNGFKILFFLLCFLCLTLKPAAQTVNITSISSDLTPCSQSEVFSVSLQNLGTDTLTAYNVFLGLAPGIQYIGGSVSGPGIALSSNPAPDSVFLSGDTLFPFQSITFTYEAEATCSATDSGVVFNFIRVNHSLGADSINGAPFSILRPSLAIQSITPSSVTDSLGASYNRCVTLINGGFGALQDFYVAILVDTNTLGYSNFTLAANGASLTPVYMGDSIRFYFDGSHISQSGNLDSLLQQNETLEFCYDVLIKTCGGIGSEIHAFWGCNGEICESQFQAANTIVDILPPLLAVTVSRVHDRCYGDTVPTVGKIIVKNNGAGPARSVVILVKNYNGYLARLDTSTIRWVNSTGTSIPQTPTYVQTVTNTGNATCLGATSVRSFEVTIPEIAAGEIDTLIFDVYNCCKTWCNTSPFIVDRTDYQMTYTGRCDTTVYSIPNTVVIGNNYGRVVSQAVSGPSDLLPGDTATYCIEHSNFRFYNVNPGAYATAEVILPSALAYTNIAGDFFFEDPQGDTWQPSSVQVSGDTVRGIFNFPVSSGVTLEKVDLKIRLVADCNGGPCSGGPSTLYYNLYETADTSCSCRALISCFNWDVNIHCGTGGTCNCNDGGMIFQNFEVYRTNLGQPDNNEDGLPDATGTIDSTQVRMNYAMFGDTLTTIFHGLVDTVTANPFFTQGYAVSVIEGGDHLTPISYSMDIYDLSASSVYSCNLTAPTITPLAGDVREFTYAFDTAQLSSCLPPNYVFDEGDSVVLTANYKVTGNIQGAVRSEGLSNYFGLINTTSGDTASCDSFGGAFVLVGYYYTNCCFNRWYSSYCNQLTISQNYYLSIGNCCANYTGGNIFTNEFRYWGGMKSVEIVVPYGYTFVSATLEHRRTSGTQGSTTINTPLSAAAFNGDTVLVNLDSTWITRNGPIPLGDDGHLGIVRVTLEPGCQAADNHDRIYFIYEFDPIPALTGPGAYPVRRSSYDSLKHRKADLDLSPLLPLVSGIGATVDWEFSITNNSNSFISNNSWFSFVSPSGQIVPVTVEDTVSNTVLIPVNGIYQVGDIDPDSVRIFRMSATYGSCDLDSILLLTGWDCAGYPTAAGPTKCVMDSAYLKVEPQPSQLQANLSIPAGPFDICDSIPVQLDIVSSQVADVQNSQVDFYLPLNGGLTYQAGSAVMEYPTGGGYIPIPNPVVTGTQLTWDINAINALIAANDLPGAIQPDSNFFSIQFVLETNCNFISGDRFLVEAGGDRPCGDPLAPIRQFSDAIEINGVNQPYTTNVAATVNENSSCPMNQSMDVILINTGAGTTSIGDSIYVDLNPGYSYTGNFVGGVNAPVPNAPGIQVFASGTRLSWPMPAGLAPGDSVAFTFDLDIASTVGCGNDLATISSVFNTNLFCARTGMNCSAGAQTGSSVLSIPISRPDLSFSSFSATRNQITGGWEYFYSGALLNSGAAIPGGSNTEINFFCDTDMSGGYSVGDSLLGTYTTTLTIPNGGTVPFNGLINYNNSACADSTGIFAVVFPDPVGGYCLCDTAEANTNVILPVNAVRLNGEAVEQGNLLTWEIQTPQDFSHFLVEREAGNTWQVISNSIGGQGPSFSFLDLAPGLEETYRVRAEDQNGQIIYSNAVILKGQGLFECQLYPNPAGNSVTVGGPEGTQFRVMDLLGNTLQRGELVHEPVLVNLKELSNGIYLVEFEFGGQKQVKKLVVEQ